MQWIAQLAFVILIHWIAIYPVDSAIQLLNNWGLVGRGESETKLFFEGTSFRKTNPVQCSSRF